MSLRFAFAGFIAAIGVLVSGASANAAFQVQVRVDGNLVGTVVDNDVNDTNTTVNRINFNEQKADFSIPNFSLSGDIALTNLPGTGFAATLSNNVNVIRTTLGAGNNGGASVIELITTATGFTMPDSDFLRLFESGSGTFSLTNTAALVTLQSFADAANALNGMTTAAPPLVFSPVGPSPIITQSFSGSPAGFTPFIDPSRPFSITNIIRIVLNNEGGEVDATIQTIVTAGSRADQPVPEPGSMALLALGGLGLVGRAVRRRRAAKVA